VARILLIDDNNEVRDILGEVLTRSGHLVIAARDGEEGLELFPHAAADLVITDMVMPGKCGREVMRELRRLQPHVKIIAMSGGDRFGREDLLGAAMREGAAGVLSKPFTFGMLLTAINGVLEAGRAGAVDGNGGGPA
jgi:CheY-like chemotaxis protein